MAESQNGLNTGLNTSANTGAQFATKQLDNPLWQYACQFYSQPGVESALLELQDKHGADINLVLQALWLASVRVEWGPSCIPHDYQKWMDQHVLPLRQMRRTMKIEWPEERGKEYEEFRQQVKKLELKAEQVALAMLFASSEGLSEGDVSENTNMILVGQSMDVLPEQFDSLISLLP